MPAVVASTVERLATRHARVDARRLHQRTDPPDHVGQAAGRLGSEHAAAAGARPGETEEAADRRGLAGPVRPEEAEHAAGTHRQVEAVECPHPPAPPPSVALAQRVDLDHRTHRDPRIESPTTKRCTRRPGHSTNVRRTVSRPHPGSPSLIPDVPPEATSARCGEMGSVRDVESGVIGMPPTSVHFNGGVNLADAETVMREIATRVPDRRPAHPRRRDGTPPAMDLLPAREVLADAGAGAGRRRRKARTGLRADAQGTPRRRCRARRRPVAQPRVCRCVPGVVRDVPTASRRGRHPGRRPLPGRSTRRRWRRSTVGSSPRIRIGSNRRTSGPCSPTSTGCWRRSRTTTSPCSGTSPSNSRSWTAASRPPRGRPSTASSSGWCAASIMCRRTCRPACTCATATTSTSTSSSRSPWSSRCGSPTPCRRRPPAR